MDKADNPSWALLEAHNKKLRKQRLNLPPALLLLATVIAVAMPGVHHAHDWLDLWLTGAIAVAFVVVVSELMPFLAIYNAPDSYFPIEPRRLLDGFALRSCWRSLFYAAPPFAISLFIERWRLGEGLIQSLSLAAAAAVVLPLICGWCAYAAAAFFTRRKELLLAALVLPLPLMFFNTLVLLPFIIAFPPNDLIIVRCSLTVWVLQGAAIVALLARGSFDGLRLKFDRLRGKPKSVKAQAIKASWFSSNCVYLRENIRLQRRHKIRPVYIVIYWAVLALPAFVLPSDLNRATLALGLLGLIQAVGLALITSSIFSRLKLERPANHWDALLQTSMDARTYVDGLVLTASLPRYWETSVPTICVLVYLTKTGNWSLALAGLLVSLITPIACAYRSVLSLLGIGLRSQLSLTLYFGCVCVYANFLFKLDPTPYLALAGLTALYDAYSVWRARKTLTQGLPLSGELPLNAPRANVLY